MLKMKKVQQMTDIIHNSIPYSGIEHSIISTPIYNRLHRILQSSLVFLTYPSNKVKRFEHSIGTMHIAGNMFFNSLCNADSTTFDSFINDVSAEIIKCRKSLDFNQYSFINRGLRLQYNDDILSAPVPDSEFYNRYRPQKLRDEQMFSYYVAFQSVRLSALLHDVGHLPYSHILEHALKKMYIEIKQKENKNAVENEFLTILERFTEGQDEIHEEIGKCLVNIIRNCITINLNNTDDSNIFFFLSVFELTNKIIYSKSGDNTIFSDLHSITASSLDADRLDYCSRDAYCAGTNKYIFPYDRLLFTYKLEIIDSVIDTTRKKRYYFCPSTKSISLTEELLRRRFRIFTDINFHHRVHKHELLLEEVISKIGLQELQEMTEIGELPDAIPLKVSSIWKLVSKLEDNNGWLEYQIIQLDDSWLDTLLKNSFFEKYKGEYLSMSKYGSDILWNQFDELISTTKHYHSLFKRSVDFRKFDKLLFNNIIINANKSQLKKYFGISKEDEANFSYNNFSEPNKSLIFNYCIEHFYKIDSQRDLFFKDLEKNLNSKIVSVQHNVTDCLLRPCLFSFGYKQTEPIYLWDVTNKNENIRIEQISSQLDSFLRERALSPIFHLYYLPAYDNSHNEVFSVNKNDILKILAEVACEMILLEFKKMEEHKIIKLNNNH